MSDLAWLFLAFLAAWVVFAAYLYTLGARQRKLEQRLGKLNSKRESAPS